MNANTALTIFAVLAAFGLVMATAAVILPIVQQANAVARKPSCPHNIHQFPPCKPAK